MAQCPRGMEIQTVLFDTSRWNARDAKRWLRDHDLKAPKVDRGATELRFRQRPPSAFESDSFRTISLGPAKDKIQAVVACPKKGRESDKGNPGHSKPSRKVRNRLGSLERCMRDGIRACRRAGCSEEQISRVIRKAK